MSTDRRKTEDIAKTDIRRQKKHRTQNDITQEARQNKYIIDTHKIKKNGRRTEETRKTGERRTT